MKQYIIGGLIGLILMGGLTAGVGIVGAKNATLSLEGTVHPNLDRIINAKNIAQAWFANGNIYAVLRGQVTEVRAASNSFVMKGFGGEWTINVAADAKFLGNDFGFDDLKSEMFIEVRGVVSMDKNLTLEAKRVKVWITKEKDENKQIPSAIQPIGGSVSGTIANLSLGQPSFTMTTADGKTLTVTLSSATSIRDSKKAKIAFSDLQSGDKITVFGRVSQATLSARLIRDLSIPR